MSRPIILVVEDDEALLAGICEILEMADYQVLSAADGSEALDIMRSVMRTPDLIVSDVFMPIMDGYTLLESVRQETEWMEIPFIFLTALSQSSEVRRGMIAGVDDYLTKPFKTEDLLLTIRAKLKRRAELANVRAAQIRQVKAKILTILNHEFRTPITPVIAYADMLNQDPTGYSPEELRLFVSGINTGAKRLRQLVEDFMMLIELETGQAEESYHYRKRPMSEVVTLFQNTLAHTLDLAAAKGLEISVDPDLPLRLPKFVADPEYLQSAVIRLVDNAIKFTDRPGSEICLSACALDDLVLISVTDHGRGIPESEFEAIFDPFYQINREHYEDQGSGSGLAIVRAIMDLHGGSVNVQSEVGVGSVFTLVLPTA